MAPDGNIEVIGKIFSEDKVDFDTNAPHQDNSEIIKINDNIKTIYQHCEKKRLHCIFEIF